MPQDDNLTTDEAESYERASHWKSQIYIHDQDNDRWHGRGRNIIKRYRDVRATAATEGSRRLNILWANTQIYRPAVYGKCPTPMIERRFLDHDATGRMSAQMLQRAVDNELALNNFNANVKRAVIDFLLPGRGQVWLRYEPTIGNSTSIPTGPSQDMEDEQGAEVDDDEKTSKLEDTGEQVIEESVPVDYVAWQDFYIFPSRARTWAEVQAVGKRIYMSRNECTKHFGDKIGNLIQPDDAFVNQKDNVIEYQAIVSDRHTRSRVVYEIWNKSDRKVYWVSSGYQFLCAEKEDPLKLRKFFPCPEPLSFCLTNETMEPVPFFFEYQDQATQIDELTQRISQLAKAAKVAGCYDASNRALRRLLDESLENELIPVEDWARFSEKNGLEGAISFMPLKDIIDALQVAVEVRQKVIEDCDRISGVIDVLRGTGDGRETLGGQRVKKNEATTRLDDNRAEVARFARDIVALITEIIAKHFTDKSLVKCSGVLYLEGISKDDLEELFENPDLTTPLADNQPKQAETPLPPGATFGGPPPQPPMGGGIPVGASSMPPAPSGAPMPGAQPPQQGQGGPMLPPQDDPLSRIKRVQKSFKLIDKAIKLIHDEIELGYRVDIETDSTLAANADEERGDAIDFLTMVTKFLETAQQIAASNPSITPLLGKFLQFGVRRFRTGRDLESAIDEYVDIATKQAKILATQPPKQTPEELKMQMDREKAALDMQKTKMTIDAQVQNDQRQAAIQQQNDARDAQIQQMQDARDQQLENARFQIKLRELNADMAAKREEMEMNLHYRREEHVMNMRELELKAKENDKAREDRATKRKEGAKASK